MSTAACFTLLAATTGQPVNLAMQRLWLTGQVLPAGARLVVEHVFRSQEDHPLEVIYSFPLPRDASLHRFRITGNGFEAQSELKATESAVKEYEQGIARGSLSTLARQHQDGVVNLTVGNIRPKETVTVHLEILCGVELNDQGFRFRFPFTLAPTYHSQAKTARTAPGVGEMELPASQFGDMLLPPFHEDASALHQVGFDLSLVGGLGFKEIGSPSHVVRVRQQANGSSASVTLNAEKDMPDRDLVLDARWNSIAPQVLAGRRAADGKGHFAAIIPSTSFGETSESARRIVILLDRSGSMQGAPISQARKAIAACLGLLSDADSFGLIAFDDRTETFEPTLVPGSRAMRDEAQKFLLTVDARGGTELVGGFRAATKLLDDKGGDVLILTDGQVSGTEEILAAARATNVRLHCLGIGSASQDRFLTLLSRETGGVSRFVTPRERVDLSAVDLFASIGRPVAYDLQASADIQPTPPAMVFSGTPILLFGESSHIELSWKGGSVNLPVEFIDSAIGETVFLLQGARLITDWESRYPIAAPPGPLEKRKEDRVSARLLALSETYGLASREMSLVSVVKRVGDRQGDLPDTRVVAVGMPQDTAFDAYFAALPRKAARALAYDEPMPGRLPVARPAGIRHPTALNPAKPGTARPRSPQVPAPPSEYTSLFGAAPLPPQSPEDALLDLASHIDSDGGMPGKKLETRASATVIALLAFLSQGHTTTSGAFRSHVAKLVSFLKSLTNLSDQQQQLIAAVVERAINGAAPVGEWIKLAQASGTHWKEVETALRA